jgi:hypothetical protein
VNNAVLGERVEQLVSVATEQGFPQWRAQATIYCGLVKVKKMAMWRREYRSFAALPGRRHGRPIISHSWPAPVRSQGSLILLDEALQIVERTGERWLEAELNRHKGQLLLRQGHSEVAEELYYKALSIAAEQEASSGNCAPR